MGCGSTHHVLATLCTLSVRSAACNKQTKFSIDWNILYPPTRQAHQTYNACESPRGLRHAQLRCLCSNNLQSPIPTGLFSSLIILSLMSRYSVKAWILWPRKIYGWIWDCWWQHRHVVVGKCSVFSRRNIDTKEGGVFAWGRRLMCTRRLKWRPDMLFDKSSPPDPIYCVANASLLTCVVSWSEEHNTKSKAFDVTSTTETADVDDSDRVSISISG